MAKNNYLLRIKLMRISPDIWRSFIVPTNIPLHYLHIIIQSVMGWDNNHMYEFQFNKKTRITGTPVGLEDTGGMKNPKLSDFLRKAGNKFIYWYDFGDDWYHEITLKKIQDIDPKQKFPIVCVDGARACPPEDCGGPPGYSHFCEVVKNHGTEEYSELIEWWGEEYDPEEFDVNEVNELLNE
ncbi:MAG: plasmid pRiA4b ORF-3 family protein [Candidatus Cloacimonetes bacterium]|nr:plasmid pRiA4b ORF-3 family protein [Candidatus Cloacimonadota bacterium]